MRNGDPAGGNGHEIREIAQMLVVTEQGVPDAEVNQQEGNRPSDQPAVESLPGGFRDVEPAVPLHIIQRLKDDGRAVPDHNSKNHGDKDKILPLGRQPALVGQDADQDHSRDEPYRDKDAV